jgi:hypothetical protein
MESNDRAKFSSEASIRQLEYKIWRFHYLSILQEAWLNIARSLGQYCYGSRTVYLGHLRYFNGYFLDIILHYAERVDPKKSNLKFMGHKYGVFNGLRQVLPHDFVAHGVDRTSSELELLILAPAVAESYIRFNWLFGFAGVMQT